MPGPRAAARAGIDRSIADLLAQLGQIREVGVLFAPTGRRRDPTLRMTLSAMTEEQQRLYAALDLDRYRAA